MSETSIQTDIHTATVIADEPDDPESPLPDLRRLENFILKTLEILEVPSSELVVKIAGRKESAELNRQYRSIDRETNILSFPASLPDWKSAPVPDDRAGQNLLGDMLVCHPVMVDEAKAQGKTLEAHYAHICVHGVLHLLGFDHELPEEADAMEAREIEILYRLGFDNPYLFSRPSNLKEQGNE